MASAAAGPIVFAYDGSELAKAAIAEAGRQLTSGRRAVVLTVWQPFNVGFVAPREIEMNAAAADQVRAAAEQTAAQGAELAEAAGFKAESMAREAARPRKSIIEVADEQDASLIVLGSHGRSGFADVLIGSVAQDVAAHSHQPVLIVHHRK
jgi:nucleotide-binding universal stress UspA family protein